MNLPIKINLYLTDNLPVAKQRAGNPQQIVDNMKNRMFHYLVSGPNSSVPVVLEFDNILNTKNDNPYSLYISSGSVKAIFGIKYHREYNNVFDIPKNNLILRCFDNMLDDEFDEYIKQWKTDKQAFEDAIIDIYLYGKIYDNRDNLICKYILTKKYSDFSEVAVLNETDTFKFYISLLNFLKYLNQQKIIYRNLKFSNIGFDRKPDGELQLVILDYDNITLIRPNYNYYENFKTSGCNNSLCAGDLVPYYVAHDYFYKEPNWLKRLDKLYSFGLAEITMSLFFKYNEKFNQVYKLFSGLASLGPCLHYYHLMAIFDSRDKHDNIISTINSLEYKFLSGNPLVERTLNAIIINLIDKNYDLVQLPGQILDKVLESLKSNPDFKEKNEPIPIHPIGSYPPYKPTPSQVENLFTDSRTGMTDRMIDAIDKQLSLQTNPLLTSETETISITQSGGNNYSDEYKQKYLKYKQKYLYLSNKNNNF
jgi:serine/threonine protein kinase